MQGEGRDQDTLQPLFKIYQYRINAKAEEVHAWEVSLAERHPDVPDTFSMDVVDYNHRYVILVQVPESGYDMLVQPHLLQYQAGPV